MKSVDGKYLEDMSITFHTETMITKHNFEGARNSLETSTEIVFV
jgi:hypothetical protein